MGRNLDSHLETMIPEAEWRLMKAQPKDRPIMALALFLIRHREANSMTQVEVAERAGVFQSAVSMWESGKHLPKIKDFDVIAAGYEIDKAKLLEIMAKNS